MNIINFINADSIKINCATFFIKLAALRINRYPSYSVLEWLVTPAFKR